MSDETSNQDEEGCYRAIRFICIGVWSDAVSPGPVLSAEKAFGDQVGLTTASTSLAAQATTAYKKIHNTYSKKLKAQAPKLVKQFKKETKKKKGVQALANLCNTKITKLAKTYSYSLKRIVKYRMSTI